MVFDNRMTFLFVLYIMMLEFLMRNLMVVVIVNIILLSGCSNNNILSSDIYSASEAKQIQNVTYGTLIGMRPVQIQAGEDSNVVGTLGGMILGGLLGNTVGGGTGRNLATTTGALAGSVVGSSIENTVNRVQGVELEIRKDDGNTIIVVQKISNTGFSIGQRVAIVSNGKTVTISPRG